MSALERVQLARLQLAVDHIAAVIEYAPSDAVAPLSQALDLIHQAEGRITDREV